MLVNRRFLTIDGKFDCYGSENSAFLCLFSHIWKMQVEKSAHHLIVQITIK